MKAATAARWCRSGDTAASPYSSRNRSRLISMSKPSLRGSATPSSGPPENYSRCSGALSGVRKHVQPGLVVHVALVGVPVFERFGTRCGGPRADRGGPALEMRHLRPALLAEDERHRTRPTPERHVDEAVRVADHVA